MIIEGSKHEFKVWYFKYSEALLCIFKLQLHLPKPYFSCVILQSKILEIRVYAKSHSLTKLSIAVFNKLQF